MFDLTSLNMWVWCHSMQLLWIECWWSTHVSNWCECCLMAMQQSITNWHKRHSQMSTWTKLPDCLSSWLESLKSTSVRFFSVCFGFLSIFSEHARGVKDEAMSVVGSLELWNLFTAVTGSMETQDFQMQSRNQMGRFCGQTCSMLLTAIWKWKLSNSCPRQSCLGTFICGSSEQWTPIGSHCPHTRKACQWQVFPIRIFWNCFQVEQGKRALVMHQLILLQQHQTSDESQSVQLTHILNPTMLLNESKRIWTTWAMLTLPNWCDVLFKDVFNIVMMFWGFQGKKSAKVGKIWQCCSFDHPFLWCHCHGCSWDF